MPQPDTTLGYNVCLEVAAGNTLANPGAFSPLVQLTEVSPPASSIDEIETTHAKSEDATKTFRASWRDNGELTATFQYTPNKFAFLIELEGEPRVFRVLFEQDGATHNGGVAFEGFVKAVGTPVDVKGIVTCTVTVRVSGPKAVVDATDPAD